MVAAVDQRNMGFALAYMAARVPARVLREISQIFDRGVGGRSVRVQAVQARADVNPF